MMYTYAKSLLLWLFVGFFFSSWSIASSDNGDILVPLRVEQGTCLIKIARKYCVNQSAWKTIAEINKLTPPYIIQSTSTLYIPSSLLITKKTSALAASLYGTPDLLSETQTSTLHKGDRVFPGQTIVTGSDEYVHLVYPDNRHTRIGPNTSMRLVYLMRLADNNLQAGFFLERGRITHQIDVKLKNNEHFQTETPVALTGVRGTEFRLKMEDESVGLVETLKGTVAVDAAGKKRKISQGQGSRIKKGKPPSPPHVLPSPPHAPALMDYFRVMPVVIPAPKQNDAEMVRLRITRDDQGTETFYESAVRPGQSFIIPSLDDGSYFLFLTAVDAAGFESLPTGPLKIKVRTNPAAPLISSPKNGLTVFEPTMTIKWLRSDLAKFYRVQLATDSDFTDIIAEKELTENRMTTEQLKPGKYFFRVQIVTDDGFATLYSVPLSCTLLEPPKLGDGKPKVNEDGSIQLQWPAIGGASGYALQISANKDFSTIAFSRDNLSKPSCRIDEYLAPKDYFVRIRPLLKNGDEIPWTPPQTMTIDPEPFSWGNALSILILGIITIL